MTPLLFQTILHQTRVGLSQATSQKVPTKMEALSRISFLTNYTHSHFPIFSPLPHTQKPLSKKTSPTFSSSLLRTSSRPVCEVAEEDVLQMFFKDRELNGDFISKTSDMFWLMGALKFVDFDADAGKFADNSEQAHQVIESDNDDGFLKLLKTHEWLLGDNSAPINKKPSAKALQDDSERRKRLNLLKYEALKRELMLLSVGIGTAWSGYCLITLSVQAAFSYVVGVLFRLFQPCLACLYIRLPSLFKFTETVKTCNWYFQKMRKLQVTEIIHISILLEYFILILKYFQAESTSQRLICMGYHQASSGKSAQKI
ncbi:uncharacterized protein LOC102624420 isoform X5 [Citrus sinensis]|uniref:uncharacterized protein LOC102624420 isoform X3 n=1 Tax=Citrus sinensis TaxID=2711 RepID=UPI0022795456|nr:uncharacterized protein LOC102624420 isoform X3 [Citrus sinensis]XP_052287772.1 uncharacterized protein LOC102624420 isoform X4 [Citrus sinensis]XP_052287773.1 uncharacterized protein LOC102624420 isoform X5 [Citrus sinensis]